MVELVTVLFVSFVELVTVLFVSFVELVTVLFVSFVELVTSVANAEFTDMIYDMNKIKIKPNASKFFPVLFRLTNTENPCAPIAFVESCHFIHKINY